MSWLTDLARAEIAALKPYDHAAWEPGLDRLHANEMPWRPLGDQSEAGLNRYPEPQPGVLLQRLAQLYGVAPQNVLVGRGSDEMIDLLVRAYCRAGQDSIAICPPTFGMYAVSARIQGAGVVAVPLRADDGFSLDEAAIVERCTPAVKLLFLCSPNNPTGNLMSEAAILRIAAQLAGRTLIVVDEAYIEFAGAPSFVGHIASLPQIVVLRTLSKAHGLAGVRCGALIADPEIVALLRKVLTPYAVPQLAVEAVCGLLASEPLAAAQTLVEDVRRERDKLIAALAMLPAILRVWPSAANFVLAEFHDAGQALTRARAANLLIRDVRSQPGLARALRITVGTPEQNTRLLQALR